MSEKTECDHYWIPSLDKNGEPLLFKHNTQLSPDPVIYAKCSKCGDRTWFTERQWNDIPVRDEPEAQSLITANPSDGTRGER